MSTVPVAPPLCNYYTVNDSSPGSQVWDLAAGAFVAVSDATFNSWLSQLANAPVGQPFYPFFLQIQAATSSDGGTTTTFQVDNTSIMTTGAKYNISATGLYDGNQAITVVDGTHVKISVAFAGNAIGNLAGAGIVLTAAILNNLLRASGLTLLPTTGGFYSNNSIISASNVTLTNPMSIVNYIQLTGGANQIVLPAMNQPNSVPVGIPFTIICIGNTCTLFLQDGVSGAFSLTSGMSYWFQLQDNSTANGSIVELGKYIFSTLGVHDGGSGNTTLTAHNVLLGEGTSPIAFAPPGVAGRLLVSQGASADPAFVAMSGDATITNGGVVTVAKVDGVSYPASPSTNTVPVVTGANTVTYETTPVVAGGTGDTGTAWTTYTPTVASGTGLLTSSTNSGRYKTIGKTVFVEILVSSIVNGTGAGWIEASLPGGQTPKVDAAYAMAGSTLNPNMCAVFLRTINGNVGGPHARFFKYDGSYPVDGSNSLLACGVYEAA